MIRKHTVSVYAGKIDRTGDTHQSIIPVNFDGANKAFNCQMNEKSEF